MSKQPTIDKKKLEKYKKSIYKDQDFTSIPEIYLMELYLTENEVKLDQFIKKKISSETLNLNEFEDYYIEKLIKIAFCDETVSEGPYLITFISYFLKKGEAATWYLKNIQNEISKKFDSNKFRFFCVEGLGGIREYDHSYWLSFFDFIFPFLFSKMNDFTKADIIESIEFIIECEENAISFIFETYLKEPLKKVHLDDISISLINRLLLRWSEDDLDEIFGRIVEMMKDTEITIDRDVIYFIETIEDRFPEIIKRRASM